MKRMRKCVVLLLALALVVALGASAYADADTGYSITVNNAMPGETYTAYKMLSVSVNEDMTSFAYKLNGDAWDAFFKEGGAGAAYVTVDANGYVTIKADADTELFFAAAADAVTGKTATKSVVASSDKVAKFKNLQPGYYLITSTGGTRVIIDTTPTEPAPTINDKNKAPTLEKEVQEDSTGAWGEKNTAQIGDTVNFKVTITVQPGALNYVMHDKMDDGLTFSGADSVAIKIGETELAKTNYTVNTTGLTDGCTFEIAFDQTYLNSITKNTTLTVTYSAVLNKIAVAGEAELNTAYLKYGSTDNTDSKTLDSKTETNTYKFSVLKHAGSDTAKSPLAGAEFRLEVKDGNTYKTVKLVPVGTDGTTYRVANGNENGAKDTFTTVANNQITITGVDLEDNYQLVEVTAPAGYNLLKDPVEVKVNENNNLVVSIANNAGTELPSTGGTGTTMIYLAGSVLVVAALVLFITKRRMDAGR